MIKSSCTTVVKNYTEKEEDCVVFIFFLEVNIY